MSGSAPAAAQTSPETTPSGTGAPNGPSGGDGESNPTRRVIALIEGKRFQLFITILILINAVTLGLETWDWAMANFGTVLVTIDHAILGVFCFEIAIKLIAYRHRFFYGGWNVFDFVIVGISLIPATGNLSVLRALRILRVLRLLSVMPQLRKVVEALLSALPGMGAIVGVLFLVFYTGAVLSTKLFGDAFPDWFGTIGASMYTLFQIMTLESWSMGIVRPVMDRFPLAWIFFVPFIFLTSFMVLNLFIAIIVNSLNTLHQEEMDEMRHAEAVGHTERETLLTEIRAMRKEIEALRQDRRED